MNNKTKTLIKFAIAFALLLVAYIPTFKWMANRWTAPESYYGHGFLIPLISLFIIWQRRDDLSKSFEIASGTSCPRNDEKNLRTRNDVGLWIVAVCLIVHIICAALRVYFLSGFTLIPLIYGLVLFFFGKEMVHKLTFPILFLFTMVPLPLAVIGTLTVKLKLLAASVSTFVLNKIGFPSILDGSIIRMPSSYLEVAAPCSGLRSLIALLTLGLLFAYAMKISYTKKAILFLSSVPIALASNVTRIVMLGVVNDLYGGKVAMGAFHDFTGFLVFALAFAGLFGISRVLEPQKHE